MNLLVYEAKKMLERFRVHLFEWNHLKESENSGKDSMQLVNDNDRKGKKDAKQSERPIVFQEKNI